MSASADIAVIGLAVMGQNLILNMNDHDFKVVAYNRTYAKTEDFLNGSAKGTNIIGAKTLEDVVAALASPRKVMLMVKAGAAVDAVIDELIPLLDKGDIIIDGGNSNFEDSERRAAHLATKDLLFVGSGVSGGEEGARHGPSMMPGGHKAAWPHIKPIFQAIAAKTESGDPCCDWVGDGGAGHFVKMVHNGIEYGDMQLICEAYDFMQKALEMDNDAMQATFTEWNKGALDSYLIEITADILGFKDGDTYVVDTIMDKAGQKGTGKWTGINALELGIPLTLIGEAVFARALSAIKDERVVASGILKGPSAVPAGAPAEWVDALGQALFAAKIISYTQGYMLMRAAAEEYNWDLQYGSIAQMWRGGCIIRSAFLDDIKAAYDKAPELSNLLVDDYFRDRIHESQDSWRRIIGEAVTRGIPVPAMSAALSFYDGYRNARLPANLLQAQRDYFGAHTYQRVDGDESWHHTDWIGSGSNVSSSTYDA
ncbi:decarboxylating NADP(+)-dependent phosphogluconate dehydrogenase [Granulosicoccus antarcticus]|uniref:6-phosphogluconate dehydrogenase, decarboxylating n=1 Tax=Granulosicoccus antarcticus IMCC3135 TaxID=1192854 RepID=A0A2Z2NN27_9GAMM|nr:decarboxylating NADP(+)-dependent phosphogluconate dehydrogenase [Granulosicoccus antarcticus]ASJ70280.1 6-phosphogluconate dehydrogenase, decarboxylating [Granulosicoccus antarcticus IMCC3135]